MRKTTAGQPEEACDGRVRVCLLADDIGPDAGAERQLAETVKRLDPARFKVHVCCFSDSARLRELEEYASTAIFPFESVYSLKGLRQMRRFRSYMLRHRIEVAHAFMVRSAIFLVLAGMGTGCATVTSRLNTGYWYTPFYLRFFRLLNRWTTRIFVNSVEARAIAMEREKLPESKFALIYNGVDLARYGAGNENSPVAAELGIPPQARVVGMVANLRPVKDVPLFLRAAAMVAARVPEAAFVLVGQGDEREMLGRLAVELGLNGRVFFSDGRGRVTDYLARMSVACLSSQGEGFSNAILEYMAAGLPVVATDAGGNREAIVDGVTGYLVRERTPEAMAAPIVKLLECEELRAAMGRRGLEHCR